MNNKARVTTKLACGFRSYDHADPLKRPAAGQGGTLLADRIVLTGQRSYSAGRMRASTLIASLQVFAVGCGQVLGVDDYSTAVPAAGGGTGALDAGEAGLPLLPAFPDPGRVDACTDCVRRECVDEWTVCQASPRCRAMLACMNEKHCDDPNCIARCTDQELPSPYFWDYFGCAFQTSQDRSPTLSLCVEECGAGRNWECRFTWDAPAPSAEDVSLTLGNGGAEPMQPGYEVAACRDEDDGSPGGGDGCDHWTPVGIRGDATLHFGAGTFDLPPNAIGLRNIALGDRERLYGHFVRGPRHFRIQAVSSIAVFLGNAIPYEPHLGLVTVVQADCLGARATVNIALADVHPPVVKKCLRVNGTTADVDDCVTPSAVTVFSNVSPALGVVVEATRLDGVLASKRSVLVGAGWHTAIQLYPRDQTGQ